MSIVTTGQLTMVDSGDISLEISPSIIFIDIQNRVVNSWTSIAQHHVTQEVVATIKDANGIALTNTDGFTITDTLGNTYTGNKHLYKWLYGEEINTSIITITAINQTTGQSAAASLLIVPRSRQQFQLNEKTLFLYRPFSSINTSSTSPNLISCTYNFTTDKLITSINNHPVEVTFYSNDNNNVQWYRAESIEDIIEHLPEEYDNAYVTSTHVIQPRNDYKRTAVETISLNSTQWYIPVNLVQNGTNELYEQVVYLYKLGQWQIDYPGQELHNIREDIISVTINVQFKYDTINKCIRKNDTYDTMPTGSPRTLYMPSEILLEHDLSRTTDTYTDPEDQSVETKSKQNPMCLFSKSLLLHKTSSDVLIDILADRSASQRIWSTPIDVCFLRTPVYLSSAPSSNLITTGTDDYGLILSDVVGEIPASTALSDILATHGYALYNTIWQFDTEAGTSQSQGSSSGAISTSTALSGRLVLYSSYVSKSTGETVVLDEGIDLIYNNNKYKIMSTPETGSIYKTAVYDEITDSWTYEIPTYDDGNQEAETSFINATNSDYTLEKQSELAEKLQVVDGKIKTIQLYYDSTTNSCNPIAADIIYQFGIDSLFNVPEGWTREIPASLSSGHVLFIIEAAVLSNNDVVTIRASQWTTPTVYNENYNSKTIFLFHPVADNIEMPFDKMTYLWDTASHRLDQKILLNDTVNMEDQRTPTMNGWQLYLTNNNDINYNIIAAQIVPNNNTSIIQSNQWSDIITTKFTEDVSPLIANNRNITSIEEQYFLSTSANLLAGDEEWKAIPSKWSAGRYYWTRNKINWDDGGYSYTSPKLAINTDALSAAASYINAITSSINRVYRQSTRPLSGYNIGDLWYQTRPHSNDVIEYICISVTDGAPMSDWVLFNRVISNTLMNVDTFSGIIDIFASLNTNISANNILTLSGNQKAILGSDGNVEIYSGDEISMLAGAVDGHLSTLTMNKQGIDLTGQSINILTTVNTNIATNGNLQISSDTTSDSYIQFGTDEDPNKLILAPTGIESVSGEFKRLTVNGKNVLTEDWLTHRIIVSALKPQQHDVIWIQPEDSAGLFTDVSTSQIIVRTQTRGTSDYWLNYYADKVQDTSISYEGRLTGTERTGWNAPYPGDSGGVINYAYDESWKSVNSNSAYLHEHSLDMQWEQVGIQQWTDATVIAGVTLNDSSFLSSLEIAVTGTIDNHYESRTNPGAVVSGGRLIPTDVTSYYQVRGYDNVNASTIQPIVIPAGSELRVMCSYRTYTIKNVSADNLDPEFAWNDVYNSVGERYHYIVGGIFKTIIPYEISYNCAPVRMKFYLDKNINAESNTVDYSTDPAANLSRKLAWYYRFNTEFDPEYVQVLDWTPYTTFKWAYTDDQGVLLNHWNNTTPRGENMQRRNHCVPLILHPKEINEPFYKMILTRKQTIYYHDEQTLKCNVNYVI